MKLKFLLIAILTVIVSACQYPVHSGTLVNDEQIKEIEGKPFTKAEIEEKLGTPNVIPDFSENTWYYIHRNMTRRAFFLPVVHGQKIVKLTFDHDRLNAIESVDNEHNADIVVVKEYIRTKGTEMNPVQEYIRNFGRFNKTKKKPSRR
jgi:outer membrane protein assembly factor BamE (lipoprotein component of BamABCDE complex)